MNIIKQITLIVNYYKSEATEVVILINVIHRLSSLPVCTIVIFTNKLDDDITKWRETLTTGKNPSQMAVPQHDEQGMNPTKFILI